MLKTLMPSLHELISSDYNKIKNDEYEKVIADYLKGFSSVKYPILLQVSGIPGAGKSTYCQQHQNPNFLFLSFDKIMLSLPGYQKDLFEKGMVEAYKNHEMEARIVGYEILRRALLKKINIMFEHSGTNKAHLELFKNISKKGYHTAVDFIVCNTDIAVDRTKKRAKEINRYVPEKLVHERANGLSQYISAYKGIASHVRILDGENNFKQLMKN